MNRLSDKLQANIGAPSRQKVTDKNMNEEFEKWMHIPGSAEYETCWQAAWNAALEKALALCDARYSNCLEPEIKEIADEISALKGE